MFQLIHHRARKPWVFQVSNGQVEVNVQVSKKTVKKITLIYGDPMGGWKPSGWVKKQEGMTLKGETAFHEIWSGTMFISTKRFRYAFEVVTNDNKKILYGEDGQLQKIEDVKEWGKGFTYSYWNEVDFLNVPKWYRETSWYQIFPDRFAISDASKSKVNWEEKPQGHEIFGGDLKGIISKLEHIKKLGFSGVYLTPIFKAYTSHRYETNNYYEIDPILGSTRDFKKFIKAAHQLNLKVMLDAVFNHIGYHSKQFQDVIKNKEKSKYKDWFWINDFSNLKQASDYVDDEFENKYPFETFATVPAMPRLNWSNKKVKEHLIRAAEKWTKMGVDGWRLDVSFEPPLVFWKEFNKRLKIVKEDIVIVGEIWWDAINYLENDVWHGVMNYPLRRIIIDFVQSSQELRDRKIFVEKFNRLSFSYTPEQQWGMMNLMSSHDVDRLITLFKKDSKRYKQAMRLCFFNPGAPSTYYGQEIGLEGNFDPDNRRAYPWGKKLDTYFDFFKDLNREHKLFVNTSKIHDRFVAKLEGTKIILFNSTNKIIVEDFDVKRVGTYEQNS